MIPPQILAIGAVGTLLAGFLGGWTIRDWKADSAALAGTQALIKAKDAGQAKVDAKAAEFERFRQSLEPQRTETRNTIREVYRNVPVSADCALRPDALGVLENARQRANAAASGQSGEPVSDNRGDTAARS